MTNLLDYFGCWAELWEEELWVRSECLAEGSQVVRLVEPLGEQMTRLE